MLLETAYALALAGPSDINELLPVLHQYAAACGHVTEFGTRLGVSTTCFLHARPQHLISYDIQRQPGVVDQLGQQALEVGVHFQFVEADVRNVQIEATDLLFIDTWHVCEQLAAELGRHADQVGRYIAMHDTVTFGEAGEAPGHQGLWPAITSFLLDHPEWTLADQRIRNNGLTVLARRPFVAPIPRG